jgi:hypothetical protein
MSRLAWSDPDTVVQTTHCVGRRLSDDKKTTGKNSNAIFIEHSASPSTQDQALDSKNPIPASAQMTTLFEIR